MMVRHFIQILVAVAATAVWHSDAQANALPSPEGAVVLTVTGEITHTNAESAAEFDIAMLEKLGRVELQTSTLWTEGVQKFAGVWLEDIVDAVGAEGTMLLATAINDYSVDLPMSDAVAGFALVAYERNGAPMPVREKGPLWVIFPFDQDAHFRSETYHSRSIWQLDRINVQP